jgi:hypothetical protein
MLPKFKGVPPSKSIVVRLPNLVEELRRGNDQGERRNASILRGN